MRSLTPTKTNVATTPTKPTGNIANIQFYIPMEKLYYSIGEVSESLGINASTLRFWEKEFDCIHPVKNKKGNRSYTAADIETL